MTAFQVGDAVFHQYGNPSDSWPKPVLSSLSGFMSGMRSQDYARHQAHSTSFTWTLITTTTRTLFPLSTRSCRPGASRSLPTCCGQVACLALDCNRRLTERVRHPGRRVVEETAGFLAAECQVGTHQSATGPKPTTEAMDQLRRRLKPVKEREVIGVGIEALKDRDRVAVTDADSVAYTEVSEVPVRDTNVLGVEINRVDLRLPSSVSEPEGRITESCTNLNDATGVDRRGKNPKQRALVVGICSAAMTSAVCVGGGQDIDERVCGVER